MDKILALMNPFLKKELASVLYLHNSLEDFYKFVPKDILPMEYGGPEPDGIQQRGIYARKFLIQVIYLSILNTTCI